VSWVLWLIDPLTGRKLRRLPDVGFSWTISLRDAQIGSDPQNLGKGQVTSLSFPWAAFDDLGDKSELLMPGDNWVLAEQDGVPRLMCELGDTSNDDESISVEVTSSQAVLARLLLIQESAVQAQLRGDTRAIRSSTWQAKGFELGTLGVREMKAILDKPQCLPPVRFPAEYTAPADDAHTRSVAGYDLQNIDVQHLLTNLSNVTGGPDMDLRPETVDDRTVRLAFHAGRPTIEQQIVWSWGWRAGQAGGDVQKITLKRSAATVADRVYANGSGTDAGTLIAVSQSSQLPTNRLFREKVLSDTSTDSQPLLQSHADAALAAAQHVQAQLQIEVDQYGANPINRVWPGDEAQLTLWGYPNLPDATYRLRVLEMAGNSTDQMCTLTTAVMDARTMEVL
jgi:hypothetical protein